MEFNPGHLESLRKLGILNAEETTISPQDLAERILKSDKITEALSDVYQETLNAGMAFDLTCQNIDEIDELLPRLITQDEIEDELAGLAEEVITLPSIANRIENLSQLAKMLNSLVDEESIELSIDAENLVKRLVLALNQFSGEQLWKTATEKLMQGQAVVQKLKQKLDDLAAE